MKNKVVYIFPFLFAIYPVLLLFSTNVEQFVLKELFISVAAIIILTLLLWLLSFLVLKDKIKAGLLLALFWLIFFFYNHFRTLIVGLNGPSRLTMSYVVTLFIWASLFVWGAFLIARMPKNLNNVAKILSVVAAVMVVIPLASIMKYELSDRPIQMQSKPAVANPIELTALDNLPDIYYIILDRYGDSSTLQRVYGFDNSQFIQYLAGRGFYVASQSFANYPSTTSSLASSLNMRYINYLDQEPRSQSLAFEMLQDYPVWRFLATKGYRFIHFGSLWGPTMENRYADENVNYFKLPLSYFPRMIYQTSILYPVADRFVFDYRVEQWERTNYQFQRLAEISSMKEPTFVFAHLLVPHDPYVFDRDGRYLPLAEANARSREENYLGQLLFANQKIEQLVNHILSSSSVPPVIILQGDEGPFPLRYEEDERNFDWREATQDELREKMRILNAYYLPGADTRALYPSISPVNSFRLVFNLYFKAGFELLPDKAHVFSLTQKEFFKFSDVTDKVKP